MLVSVAGNVYEFGFKLGFLKEILVKNKDETWESRLRLIWETAKRNREKLGFIGEILEIGYEELTNTRYWREREKSLREILEDFGIKISKSSDETLLGVFATGLYKGRFFARHLPEGKITPVVFSIFSEISEVGVYQNADIAFRVSGAKEEFHLYDLKLYGGYGHIYAYLHGKEPLYVPPRPYGVSLSLSLGNLSLKEFTDRFIEVCENEENIDNFELGALLQVFTYLYDYLEKNKDKLHRIYVGFLPSTTDGVVFPFEYEEDNFYEKGKKLKQLYIRYKAGKENLKQEFLSSLSGKRTNLVKRRIKKLSEKLHEEIKLLRAEIDKREARSYTIIPAKGISQIRSEVKEEVKRFFNSSPWGKALILLHSTGAGKTTAVRDFLLNLQEKLIVFYIAPRIRLIEDQIYTLKEKVYVINPYSIKDEKDESLLFTRKGETVEFLTKKAEAKLKNVALKVNTAVREGKEKIFAFITLQAITRLPNSSNTTLKHIEKRIGWWKRKGYKIVFIVDEISGAKNGLGALAWLTEFVEKHKDTACLIAFDATLHSKGIFEKLWKEFKGRGGVPPCFVITNFEKNGEINLSPEVKAWVSSSYSYPAKSLRVKEHFIEVEGYDDEEEIKKWSSCLPIIEKSLKEVKQSGEQLYIYIQNRRAVSILKHLLQEKGYRVLASTSNIRSSIEAIEEKSGEYDVIISTSTLSRGVSLKNVKKTIVITSGFHDIEQNVAEEIQATARMRGQEGEEKIDKEVIRIYLWHLKKLKRMDEIVNSYIESYAEEYGIDEELIKSNELKEEVKEFLYLLRERNILKSVLEYSELMERVYKSYYNPKEKVIVPIPLQVYPIFTPQDLSTAAKVVKMIEEVVNFSLKLKDKEDYDALIQLSNTIKRAISFSIGVEARDELAFIPPFLLVKSELKRSALRNELEKAISLLQEYESLLSQELDERVVKEIKEWFLELVSGKTVYYIYGLLYIPTLAIGYEVVKDDYQSPELIYPKKITRFGLSVLGADLSLYGKIRKNPFTGEEENIFIPLEDFENLTFGIYPKVQAELLIRLGR